MLVADTVSVIAEYAATSALEVCELGRISSVWHQGVMNAEDLWNRLTAEKWGGRQRRGGGGLAVYRARMQAARLYAPLSAKELHPIENCDFSFNCPLLAEALKPTGRVAPETGNPILHCSVCNDDVYVVSSQEELDLRRMERRCVSLKEDDVAESVVHDAYPLTLFVEDPTFAQHVLSRLKREYKSWDSGTAATQQPVQYSITFEQLRVSVGDQELLDITVLNATDAPEVSVDVPTDVGTEKKPSAVVWQGSARPPSSVTRGINEFFVREMSSVDAAVQHLCGLIGSLATNVFRPIVLTDRLDRSSRRKGRQGCAML